MKKLDRLLLFSFIPPFVVTFFIALFVLIMQFLWVYIDDIIGKGVGLFILVELVFYLSISLFPLALPIAILISSVMVMGNLAERYELSSFKSAGVPLFRVMRSLMVAGALVGLFSFFCSNNFIPVANLKFKSRLYDIRKQKPTLSLEEGVFNDDFQGTVIHIGNKRRDNQTIEHVKIYNHENTTEGLSSTMTAGRGEMYTTNDRRYFVMNLYEGIQYSEPRTGSTNSQQDAFVRLSFKEWHKVFDLSEFELNRTNEELFKSHRTMLSIRQLAESIDSIDYKIKKREDNLANHFLRHFQLLRSSAEEDNLLDNSSKDSLMTIRINAQLTDTLPDMAVQVKTAKPSVNSTPRPASKSKKRDYEVEPDLDLSGFASIFETFDSETQKNLYSRAQSSVRSVHGQASAANRYLNKEVEHKRKHIFELHNKFSIAVACFIFLFIGAPMGAIIRKGGFGYPILVAIFFFMLYIILTILGKKLVDSNTLNPVLAAWLPCLILFPIGWTLSYKAMNDSKILNFDRYIALFSKIKSILGLSGS